MINVQILNTKIARAQNGYFVNCAGSISRNFRPFFLVLKETIDKLGNASNKAPINNQIQSTLPEINNPRVQFLRAPTPYETMFINNQLWSLGHIADIARWKILKYVRFCSIFFLIEREGFRDRVETCFPLVPIHMVHGKTVRFQFVANQSRCQSTIKISLTFSTYLLMCKVN